MRFHSDVIEFPQMWTLTRDLPGVWIDVTEHGSRSRKRAFEVRLEGNGTHRNSGHYGADVGEQAATWDEWGVVIARIFDLDPEAFAGSAKYPTYANATNYHYQTNWRFEGLELPKDTHMRHNWGAGQGPGGWQCSKCSAVRRFL